MDDFLDLFLDSVCDCFIQSFRIYFHKEIGLQFPFFVVFVCLALSRPLVGDILLPSYFSRAQFSTLDHYPVGKPLSPKIFMLQFIIVA